MPPLYLRKGSFFVQKTGSTTVSSSLELSLGSSKQQAGGSGYSDDTRVLEAALDGYAVKMLNDLVSSAHSPHVILRPCFAFHRCWNSKDSAASLPEDLQAAKWFHPRKKN